MGSGKSKLVAKELATGRVTVSRLACASSLWPQLKNPPRYAGVAVAAVQAVRLAVQDLPVGE